MTADASSAPAPDTIVLVHGFRVTPRSWEKWVERYEGRGYRVLAPAYPGLEDEVEALPKTLRRSRILRSAPSSSTTSAS